MNKDLLLPYSHTLELLDHFNTCNYRARDPSAFERLLNAPTWLTRCENWPDFKELADWIVYKQRVLYLIKQRYKAQGRGTGVVLRVRDSNELYRDVFGKPSKSDVCAFLHPYTLSFYYRGGHKVFCSDSDISTDNLSRIVFSFALGVPKFYGTRTYYNYSRRMQSHAEIFYHSLPIRKSALMYILLCGSEKNVRSALPKATQHDIESLIREFESSLESHQLRLNQYSTSSYFEQSILEYEKKIVNKREKQIAFLKKLDVDKLITSFLNLVDNPRLLGFYLGEKGWPGRLSNILNDLGLSDDQSVKIG